MDIRAFLQGGPIADLVSLPVRAVVARGVHSLREVRSIAEAGSYAPPSGAGRFEGGAGGRAGTHDGSAELEVSGVVLARGRVVRKGGRLFFKVDELAAAEGRADL